MSVTQFKSHPKPSKWAVGNAGGRDVRAPSFHRDDPSAGLSARPSASSGLAQGWLRDRLGVWLLTIQALQVLQQQAHTEAGSADRDVILLDAVVRHAGDIQVRP